MRMKALILGLGTSGKAAARFLLEQGAEVSAVDKRAEIMRTDALEPGLQLYSETEAPPVTDFDSVIVSPGVPRNHPLYQAACTAGIEVIGEVELAFRYLGPDTKVIGITGTNGKTTVTLLVEHVLKHSGVAARAVGNIGKPLIAELFDAEKDVLVLELSSYQLETLQAQRLDAAAILNITPDHLDRYSSFEDYAATKWRIASARKLGAPLFIGKGLSPISLLPECVEYINPVSYRGDVGHDAENVAVAERLCNVLGVGSQAFMEALESFRKPPHRLELVLSAEGVSYYNDSKATNVAAVVSAVRQLPGELVVIVGGVDKGGSYAPWREAFRGKVRKVCAIGEAAATIEEQLSPDCAVERCSSFEDAVTVARSHANPGDSVLLSPGCASFDMFRDYAHRGEEFARIVRQLHREG